MKKLAEMTDDERDFWKSSLDLDEAGLNSVISRNPKVIEDFSQPLESCPSGMSFIDSEFHRAAIKNKVGVMDVLYRVGADPHAEDDNSVFHAAAKGSANAVKWLLDNEANITTSENGGLALRAAVMSDHADIVQLLLDAGGGICGHDDAATLIKRAKSQEVIDLLKPYAPEQRSDESEVTKGLNEKSVVESVFSTNPDSEKSVQLQREISVFEYFCRTRGESKRLSLQQVVSTGIPISIHAIMPTDRSPHVVLYTSGMSAYKMKAPRVMDADRAELCMLLPPNWELDELDDPNWAWPYRWLFEVAQYPAKTDSWIGPPVTFISSDPEEYIVPGYEFTGLMATRLEILGTPTGNGISIMSLLPVHREEIQFEKEHGAIAFFERLQKKDVPFNVDLARPSAI